MVESTRAPATGTTYRARVLTALAVSVVVQAVAVYTPGSAQPDGLAGFDKLVHLLIFGVPAALAILAGGAWRPWVPPLLIGHAVASELLQAAVIPDRGGDPIDVLADVLGVILGWVVAARFAAPPQARPAARGDAARTARRGEPPAPYGGASDHR